MDQYFDDAESGGQPAPPATEEAGTDQTFTLPKSIAQGLKPGDELTVRIVADHEDSYEVQAAGSEEEPEEQSEAPSAETPAAESEPESSPMGGMMD